MSRTLNIALATLCFAGALGTMNPAVAATRTGTLTCDVAPGVGLIVASSKRLACTYDSNRGTPLEHYYGRITKVGLDVGVTTGGKIVWGVIEPVKRHTDLTGTYSGASAEATAGVGAGANILIGGSDRKISLQPLSISGQKGLNLAAGIGSITLERGS